MQSVKWLQSTRYFCRKQKILVDKVVSVVGWDMVEVFKAIFLKVESSRAFLFLHSFLSALCCCGGALLRRRKEWRRTDGWTGRCS